MNLWEVGREEEGEERRGEERRQDYLSLSLLQKGLRVSSNLGLNQVTTIIPQISLNPKCLNGPWRKNLGNSTLPVDLVLLPRSQP